MSWVTAVILIFDGRDEYKVLAAANACLVNRSPGEHLRMVQDTGGFKHPQLHIATAGFNGFDITGFLEQLRAVDWSAIHAYFVQVAIQDEHNSGVGLAMIYSDGNEEPWVEVEPPFQYFPPKHLR